MVKTPKKRTRKEFLAELRRQHLERRRVEDVQLVQEIQQDPSSTKVNEDVDKYSPKDLHNIRGVLTLQKSGRWPKVLNEWKTLERILNGCSLARYGDGEVKHMDGRRNVSQGFVPSLQKALKEAFSHRSTNYLVGVPNVFDGRQFTEVNEGYIWSMRRRFAKIADTKYEYGSSYITRGDLFPAMHYPSFWYVMSELWNGRDVVLVRGHEKRANPEGMMARARNIDRVETPSAHAWSEYGRILLECMSHPRESLYLLCVGPTATVLAMDLCKSGRWAVDIGHLGMFYRRLGIEDMTYRQVWNHRPGDPGYIKGVTDQC